mmetsp:Transcript_33649/g.46044  ORF Transcript_33649/g.46044 Transcript_33649/m.46044 type:complete len:284 (+) Transcript_33649:84-935(+)
MIPSAFVFHDEPPLKRIRRDETASDTVDMLKTSQRRPSKVRGASLPQEYILERLVSNASNRHRSWNSSVPACDWEMVECYEENTVTGLIWTDLNLGGTLCWEYLPSTLYAVHAEENMLEGNFTWPHMLPEMTSIRLDENYFMGNVDLRNLPRVLEELHLSMNSFSGEIDLTCLPQTLQALFLSCNEFSGTVDLTNLPDELEYLGLGKNELSGALNFSKFPFSLQYVYLNDNKFGGTIKLASPPGNLSQLWVQGNVDLEGLVYQYDLPYTFQFKYQRTKIVLRK